MNLDFDIFEGEEDRKACLTAMEALEACGAWPFIVRVFQLNARLIEADLKERDNFKNLEEVYSLQDKLAFVENCKNLPHALVREAKNLPPDEDEEDDT